MENEVYETKIQLKNEIDVRIDMLKNELEGARVEYHKQVDEYCDAQMK